MLLKLLLYNKKLLILLLSSLLLLVLLSGCSSLYKNKASQKLQHTYLQTVSGDSNYFMYHLLLRKLKLNPIPNDIQYKLVISLSTLNQSIGLTEKHGTLQSLYLTQASGILYGKNFTRTFHVQNLCSIPNTNNASNINIASLRVQQSCFNQLSNNIVQKVYQSFDYEMPS